MKRFMLMIVALSLPVILLSQIRAVTENGDEVLLYDDGTWTYAGETDSDSLLIPMNPDVFSKPSGASFLLKSNRIGMGFWLDPKKWSFKKAENNADAEYELVRKDEDLFAMVITEKIEIPVETLCRIAESNARGVAPDLEVTHREYRMVNGIKVVTLIMNGTTQGIKFSYYGYYFSHSGGTVQFVVYTSTNLFEEYRIEIEDLLNGMVAL